MNTQPTLFSRYKRMINLMWEDGQRKYTAAELNLLVGHHENITSWKRWNNNPFYTTRTYQTALKHLGCITKIKRGLWQINGPIPEWFGSFHINALSSNSALKELERSSIYWQSLPDYKKVNPWKNIDPMRVIASTQQTLNTNNTNTMNKTTHCVMQTITGVTLIEEFPQLTMTIQVSTYTKTNGEPGVDICDWQYFIADQDTSTLAVESICKAFNKELIEANSKVFAELEHNLCKEAKAQEATKNEGTKLYTKAQVEQLLNAFVEKAADDIQDVLQGTLENIDADDVVELDWDSYNKSMSVTMDISSNINDAVSEARDVMECALKNFDIEEELI